MLLVVISYICYKFINVFVLHITMSTELIQISTLNIKEIISSMYIKRTF